MCLAVTVFHMCTALTMLNATLEFLNTCAVPKLLSAISRMAHIQDSKVTLHGLKITDFPILGHVVAAAIACSVCLIVPIS